MNHCIIYYGEISLRNEIYNKTLGYLIYRKIETMISKFSWNILLYCFLNHSFGIIIRNACGPGWDLPEYYLETEVENC